jgi:hypothetical protein
MTVTAPDIGMVFVATPSGNLAVGDAAAGSDATNSDATTDSGCS